MPSVGRQRERVAGDEMSGKTQAIMASTLAALWTYMVLDFAMNAVVLASWWRDWATFSLSPVEMARRIPVGYCSFAIYCVGLCVLLATEQWGHVGVYTGIRVGTVLGVAFGVTFALGVYSVARIPASFLVLGPLSTAICSAGAGGAGGWVLSGVRRWRRVFLVVIGGLVVFILAVVVQNVFHIYTASSVVIGR